MGSKKAKPQITNQTSSNAPPDEVMDQYRALIERGTGVASTPYTPYSGQLSAGMTPMQNASTMSILDATSMAGGSGYAFQSLADQGGLIGADMAANSNVWQPYYEQANAATGLGATAYHPTAFSDAELQKYMSPYTQSVIDSTMANIQRNDAVQQNSVISDAIKQGNAFGGDRMGLAQAELGRGQALASGQVVAGLNNQNYSQALGMFNQQQQIGLQSDQNNAARALQAGAQYGQLGTGAQAAALQGPAAQLAALNAQGQLRGQQLDATKTMGALATQGLAAGTLQQQTQQQALDRDYAQWQNSVAFPYAQTGWLGNLVLGVGSNAGGTNTGNTTQTGGSSGSSGIGSIIGGGLSLLSALPFSDERLKENIRKIGETFDGQAIYSYNLKGDPVPQIGLMAQEVEQREPDAVHDFGGLKKLDYAKATEKAADMGEFAAGGSVPGFDAKWLIPEINMPIGHTMPSAQAPSSSGSGQKGDTTDYSKLGTQAGNLLSKSGIFGGGTDTTGNSLGGGLASSAGSGGGGFLSSIGSGISSLFGGFANGGEVEGYDDGGIGAFDFTETSPGLYEMPKLPSFADPTVVPPDVLETLRTAREADKAPITTMPSVAKALVEPIAGLGGAGVMPKFIETPVSGGLAGPQNDNRSLDNVAENAGLAAAAYSSLEATPRKQMADAGLSGVSPRALRGPMSPTDRDLIIRTVIGEAAGEPELGQAGVAHVVLNRLNNGGYGKSVQDVLFAPKQFEPWNTRRGELLGIPTDSPKYQRAAAIADRVLAGEMPDPTRGALNFANVATVRDRGNTAGMRWINDMTSNGSSVDIGRHTFGTPGSRPGSGSATAYTAPEPGLAGAPAARAFAGLKDQGAGLGAAAADWTPAPVPAAEPASDTGKGGLFGTGFQLSPEARQAMLVAGLTMMAKSGSTRDLGSIIGAGGLAGVSAYNGAGKSATEAQKNALEMEKLRGDVEDRRLNSTIKARSLADRLEAMRKEQALDTAKPAAAPTVAETLTAPLKEAPAIAAPLNIAPAQPQEPAGSADAPVVAETLPTQAPAAPQPQRQAPAALPAPKTPEAAARAESRVAEFPDLSPEHDPRVLSEKAKLWDHVDPAVAKNYRDRAAAVISSGQGIDRKGRLVALPDVKTNPLDLEGKRLSNEKARQDLAGKGFKSLIEPEERAKFGVDPTFKGPVQVDRDGQLHFPGKAGTEVTLKNEGTIPAGYQVERDEKGNAVRMVPIPGAPSDRETKEKVAKTDLAKKQAAATGNVVLHALDDIDRLMTTATLPTTGGLGAYVAQYGGTAAHDIKNALTTIGANISFDALARMRAASPTGGALGAVSDTEQAMLKNSAAALEQSQSPEQFKLNLGRLRSTYNLIVHGTPDAPKADAKDADAEKSEPEKPKATALPDGYDHSKALDEARTAIASGKPRAAVVDRLKSFGIDTSGL